MASTHVGLLDEIYTVYVWMGSDNYQYSLVANKRDGFAFPSGRREDVVVERYPSVILIGRKSEPLDRDRHLLLLDED